MDRPDVKVGGGKYTFQQPDDDYRIYVRRHRDQWLVIEKGSNAIAALLHEHREALKKLRFPELPGVPPADRLTEVEMENSARGIIIGKLGVQMLRDDAELQETSRLLEAANDEIVRLREKYESGASNE